MKVHEGLNNLPPFKASVVTSGTFDGVHVGHQEILKRLILDAREEGSESILLTFWPHPRMVLQQGISELKLLSTMEEKKELLAGLGLDHLVIVPFTREFSQMSSNTFIREVLVDTLKVKRLVIGYDHRFGKNREGSFEELKKNAPNFGFTVEEISKQVIDEVAVSSTKIRQSLLHGEIEKATHLLGRKYSLQGEVVSGQSMGKILGFPTANIRIRESYKLIPEQGVYAVWVWHKGMHYGGMMNIGTKPTFGVFEKQVEVHIFDFSAEIYGDELKLEFVRFIRPEKKFEYKEALMAQLTRDEEAIRILLKDSEHDQ